MQESPHDLLIRAATLIQTAREKARSYNDFGGVMGVIDEAHHLAGDAVAAEVAYHCEDCASLRRQINDYRQGQEALRQDLERVIAERDEARAVLAEVREERDMARADMAEPFLVILRGNSNTRDIHPPFPP